MHILLKGQILGGGQRHTGGGDTLDGGVVGQVGEQHGAVDGAGAAELLYEVLGLLKGDADGGKHDGEIAGAVQNLGLTGDLSGQLRVGQTGAGEDGQLLAADQRVQTVDGGNAGLNKLVGIVAGGGVHGQTVDVAVLLGQDLGAAVDGLAHAVEHAAQHIAADGQLKGMAEEADLGLGQVDAGGGGEQLDNGLVAVDLQHLGAADGAVGQLHLGQLVIGDALDMIDHHQRGGDLLDRAVFFNHQSTSPLSAISSI